MSRGARLLLRLVPDPVYRMLARSPLARRFGARLLPAEPRLVKHCQPDLALWVLPRRSKGEWLAGGFHGYEVEEVAAVRRLVRPGDLVFDVGAHVGFYTTLFSRLVEDGAVVAFEPDGINLGLLRRNLERNGARNVLVVDRAVSDVRGVRRFALDDATGSSGSLEYRTTYGAALEQGAQAFRTVRTTTLDAAAAEYGVPAFVKIDVEGHELAVLHGAAAVLASERLRALLLEVCDDPTRPAVFELLKRSGFRLIDVKTGQEREGVYGSLLASRTTARA